jgi:hypothetical protein
VWYGFLTSRYTVAWLRDAGVIAPVHSRKPEVVVRGVLPALMSLLNDVAKVEVRTSCASCLQACVRCVGRDAVLEAASGLPDASKSKLVALL